MSYRVFWTPLAEERLENILKSATDPLRLAEIAKEIDRRLVADPRSFGESRYETVRIGISLPVGVQFEILEDVHTVIVFDVWVAKRK